MLPGLHQEYLAHCISKSDLANADCIAGSINEIQLAELAGNVLKDGFTSLLLDRILVKSNVAYHVKSTPHAVVLRALSRIIKQATRLRPSDRDTVVRRIQTVLAEGVPHRVYKFDIRAFFESINPTGVFETLATLPNVPRTVTTVLQSYLDELASRGIDGVPRGVPLSATLSECALQTFDKCISVLPDVYFHARYVDDIIIITAARENPQQFIRTIKRLLPSGLELNSAKEKVVDLTLIGRSNGHSGIKRFDYLGYRFDIHQTSRDQQNKLHRVVDVAIAKRKLKRIKSRLALAANAFSLHGDIIQFERQLQLLTGNYNVRDMATGRERNVGLYCNYRRINTTSCLDELDSYFRSLLVGNRSRISKRISNSIPKRDRLSFLKHNFARCFDKRVFYNFTPIELVELRRCWRNV